jgi:hypothetical protein
MFKHSSANQVSPLSLNRPPYFELKSVQKHARVVALLQSIAFVLWSQPTLNSSGFAHWPDVPSPLSRVACVYDAEIVECSK